MKLRAVFSTPFSVFKKCDQTQTFMSDILLADLPSSKITCLTDTHYLILVALLSAFVLAAFIVLFIISSRVSIAQSYLQGQSFVDISHYTSQIVVLLKMPHSCC